jgi:hypothetical protein
LTFELLFLRGNGASVARIVPYAALHYMAYEEYRRWIILGFPNVEQGPILDLVAGSIAGGTAVIYTYPLDLVRTKLAYQVGFTPCIRKITLLYCGSKSLLLMYKTETCSLKNDTTAPFFFVNTSVAVFKENYVVTSIHEY